MLRTRVITAAIALPAFIAALQFLPSWCVLILFLVSVIIATYEISRILIPSAIKACSQYGGESDSPDGKLLIITSVSIALAIFLASAYGAGRSMIVFGALGSMLIAAFSCRHAYAAVGAMMGSVVSICYGALPWLAVWELYLWNGGGPKYLLFLFAIVWGGDTGAYFVGKKWGQTPLAPTRSPRKTWEGAIGGLISSVLCAFLVHFFYASNVASGSVVFLAGVFGGIFAQLGDLLESSFKRFAQTKDSGSIFPGHGGFLDRVDGVLFAAPVVWFILFVSRIGFSALR